MLPNLLFPSPLNGLNIAPAFTGFVAARNIKVRLSVTGLRIFFICSLLMINSEETFWGYLRGIQYSAIYMSVKCHKELISTVRDVTWLSNSSVFDTVL